MDAELRKRLDAIDLKLRTTETLYAALLATLLAALARDADTAERDAPEWLRIFARAFDKAHEGN